MRGASEVLRRLEDSLRHAVEGVGRLLPGKLQPLELAAELRRAMQQSQTQSPEGTYVANRYQLRLSPSDLDLFGGLREELEAQLAEDLAEYAREEGYLASPLVRVSMQPAETLSPGRVQVTTAFDSEPLPARLTVLGGMPPQSWEIRGQVTLGRSDLCHVRLEEPAVSRQHARLYWTYPGYVLEDLGSQNGTFVGGAPISRALLREGDVIEVGLVQLGFSYRLD